jgi:hypothetical protein
LLDPAAAGEADDRRRGVSGCCCWARAGAGGLCEEEADLGVAGLRLRWKPMAALTRPATMAAGLAVALAGAVEYEMDD